MTRVFAPALIVLCSACSTTVEWKILDSSTSKAELRQTVAGREIVAGVETIEGDTPVEFRGTKVIVRSRVGHRGIIRLDRIELDIDSVRLHIDERELWVEGARCSIYPSSRDGCLGNVVEIDGETGRYRIGT